MVGVVADELEDEELELLEDGLVGHRLLPVTGTTGVVVPLLGLSGVPVPAEPLPPGTEVPEPGALGEGVPAEVLGADVPAGVPVVGMVVAPWVNTEVEYAADGV